MPRTSTLLDKVVEGIVSAEFHTAHCKYLSAEKGKESHLSTSLFGRLGRWAKRVVLASHRPTSHARLAQMVADMPITQRRRFAQRVLDFTDT